MALWDLIQRHKCLRRCIECCVEWGAFDEPLAPGACRLNHLIYISSCSTSLNIGVSTNIRERTGLALPFLNQQISLWYLPHSISSKSWQEAWVLSSTSRSRLQCEMCQLNKWDVLSMFLIRFFNEQRTHKCLATFANKIIIPWLGITVSSNEQKFRKITVQLWFMWVGKTDLQARLRSA